MRRILYTVFLVVFFCAFALRLKAQTCTGSLGAPVINETFGHSTLFDGGSPLPTGVTDLTYVYGPGCGGEDGTYAILQRMGSSAKAGHGNRLPTIIPAMTLAI